MGKPKVRKHPASWWDEQPLGEMQDTELARRLGQKREKVARERVKRGIPVFSKGGHIDWDNIPLGKMTDHAISERYDVDRNVARRERHRRGIPSYAEGKSARGIVWDDIPLGTMSDGDISIQYGVTRSAVGGRRRKLGIPAYNQAISKSSKTKGIDWDEQMLGRMPDATIARRLGVGPGVASSARGRRGILPYQPKTHGERCAQFVKDVLRWRDKQGGEVPEQILEYMRWHGFIEDDKAVKKP